MKKRAATGDGMAVTLLLHDYVETIYDIGSAFRSY
jgi:hypothetical protein